MRKRQKLSQTPCQVASAAFFSVGRRKRLMSESEHQAYCSATGQSLKINLLTSAHILSASLCNNFWSMSQNRLLDTSLMLQQYFETILQRCLCCSLTHKYVVVSYTRVRCTKFILETNTHRRDLCLITRLTKHIGIHSQLSLVDVNRKIGHCNTHDLS